VPTNYDTDTFQGIIKKIETLSTCKYDMDAYFTDDYVQKGYNKAFKIIADHIRSATFAIGDGAQPSNKDRGSVIRRLIRRSIVVARKINIEKPFLGEVAKAVVEVMKDFYPELVTYQSQIIETLEKEEKLFGQTLSKGYKLFADTIAKSNKLDPETVFKLSDTYGFPFEVIKELSIEKNIEIDEDKFNEMVIKHQNISRANLEIKGMAVQSTGLLNFKDDAEFIYGQYELNDSNLIGIFDEKFEPLQQSSSAC
jgi:alanyl-tRNA synthetase